MDDCVSCCMVLDVVIKVNLLLEIIIGRDILFINCLNLCRKNFFGKFCIIFKCIVYELVKVK